ncbi:hypothetical protein [Macrococcus lamae]|uniref:Uncharacterized protein n=1 Tax=Macrococcus lamae TaxID=198484 RepID=A0A4R6BT81_9STAP|nr:hypothetical protein [Macrococcus lamae]TDM07517.1 hypothetical protein ERX29_08770 [Macrococcus lamae]
MNIIFWLIIGAEIAFWLLVLGGLTARYIWKKPRLSLILFALVPVVDLILLASATIDMIGGATATFAHSLAAVYIAVSLVFGKRMIAGADAWYRKWILKESGEKKKLYGMEYSIASLKFTLHHLAAYLIGTGLMWLVIWLVGNSDRTLIMSSYIKLWSVIMMIDIIITVTYFIWPRKRKTSDA